MAASDEGLASLPEDLILLSMQLDSLLVNVFRLTCALRGSELVRLAGAGRVVLDGGRITGPTPTVYPHLDAALADLTRRRRPASARELARLAAAGQAVLHGDRITVLDARPTGDQNLDAALTSLTGTRRPPLAGDWVRDAPPGIRHRYLQQMAAAGLLSAELPGGRRYTITRPARAAVARRRLDAIALTDDPVGIAAAALAGLAVAAGLPAVLYPGRGQVPARWRLERAGKGGRTAPPEMPGIAEAAEAARRGNAPDAAPGTPDAAARAAAQLAAHAAVHAPHDAVRAATHAAAHAAACAAVLAATRAAMDAATRAATDAGHR